MIEFYWRGKKVSEKVMKVSFENCTKGAPVYCHGGFGFIVKCPWGFNVYGATGSFMKANAAGGDMIVSGQHGGVYYHESLLNFIKGFKP